MHRPFALLATVSLLLCATAVILWARSWRHPPGDEDRFSWLGSDGRRHTVRSDAGRLDLFAAPQPNLAARPTHRPRTPAEIDAFQAAVETLGRGGLIQAWDRTRPAARPSDPSLGQVVGQLRNDHQPFDVLVVPENNEPDGRPRIEGLNQWIDLVDPPANWLVETGGTVYVEADHDDRDARDPSAFAVADVRAALPPLLEDADRFVVAHAILCHLAGIDIGHDAYATDGSAAAELRSTSG